MKSRRIIHRGGMDPERYMTTAEEIQLREYVRKQLKNSQDAGKPSARPALDYMIIELLLVTGLRADELVRLKIRETPAHHGHDQIKVSEGKGGVSRTVAVRPEISTMIRDYVKHYRKGAKPASALLASERGYRRMRIYTRERKKGKTVKSWHKIEHSNRLTYQSLLGKFKRICKKAGLRRHRTPHMMRHTFGHKLYGVDHDIYNVQRQLGHKNIQTTMIYIWTDSGAEKTQADRVDERTGLGYSRGTVGILSEKKRTKR